MIFFKIMMGLFFILINFYSVHAQAELTGFFDVYNSYEFKEKEYSGFQINQFELDVSYSYQECLSLGTALAYNPDNRQFELAMAFLHYNIFKKGEMHPRRVEESGHSGIIIGKFDLPFGLDYLNYAATDRPVFSAPLVLERTIGARNDIGINYHIKEDKYKLNICAVNGFNKGACLGMSTNVIITGFLQIGASYTSDFKSVDNIANWARGVDIMAELGMVEIKSEYIWTKGLLDGEQDLNKTDGVNQGMYFQVLTQLNSLLNKPYFLTLRYGFWNASKDYDANGINDRQNRITFGLGYQLNEGCSVRMEMLSDQSYDEARSLKTTVQLVTGF